MTSRTYLQRRIVEDILCKNQDNILCFSKNKACEKFIKLTETRQRVLYDGTHIDIITSICIKNWKDIKNIHLLAIDENDEENDGILERLTYDEILNNNIIYNITTYNKEMLEFQHLINRDSDDFVNLLTFGKSIVPSLISGSHKGLYLYIDSDDHIQRNVKITFSRINNKETFRTICDFVHYGSIKQIYIEEHEISQRHYRINISGENIMSLLISVPKDLNIGLQISANIFYTNTITRHSTIICLDFEKIDHLNILNNYSMTTCDLYCLNMNNKFLEYMNGFNNINKITINEDSTIIFNSDQSVNFISKIYYLSSGEFIYNNLTNAPLLIPNIHLHMTRQNTSLERNYGSLFETIGRYLPEMSELPIGNRLDPNDGTALEI